MDKVLLIGVTGGTGGNVVKGFLEQGVTNLRVLTRKIDLNRSSLSKLNDAGVELVEANLDDEDSLEAAFAGISAVYCHATAADSAKPDRKRSRGQSKLHMRRKKPTFSTSSITPQVEQTEILASVTLNKNTRWSRF